MDLYISNTWASRPVLAPGHSSDLPVVTSFNYSSTGVGTAGEEILVPKSAIARMCANRGPYCYLLVGVYGSHGEERMSDSESIQPDNRDGMVYIERAGAGVDVADSSYSIVVTSKDSIIALVNGVPVKGRVVLGAAQYYMYRMITAKKDLVISVTPLYGDPDLYVSFSPVTHPTRSNYTYVAASDGADTLTLQASMLSLHCFLDPATNKACDIYIGVLAWRNSSYTLVASVNDGFESRISLLDGQPQTGAVGVGKYVYYEYQVGSASNTGRNPLRFSLFSLNGMDLDLYLTFKNQSSTGKSSDNDIPGMSRNDYSSTNIDGASDEILVSPGDPHFCTECTVYLAVYAFSGLLVEGEYVLVASFGGVEELPQGRVASGVVKKGFYRYYYFHNEDSLAHISIGLTMQTGDADLCISTYNPDASSQFLAPLSSLLSSSSPVSRNDIGRVAMVLPTMQSSMWRSMHFGDDLVKINYDDKNFCYNCDYIIGVFGFKNSTYTLLASTADDVVTKLVPNSALEVASEVGGVKLFSVGTLNSADDVLFTVTPLDSGDEDLYLQVYQNDSVLSTGHLLLNISDPRTYKYTTKGTQYDFILVKGPHAQGTTFVVAVHATDSIMPFTDVKLSAAATSGVPQSIDTLKQLSAMSLLSSPVPQTRYTILASYSQQHVLLMSGVPQNHYVSKGDTEFFRFIPEEDTDMRITVTARSGDPDLFVSSDFEYPRCDRGGSSQIFNCNNYTWSSRLYSSDQIIISRDFPCEAVLSSTVVSKTCNSSRSYQPRKHKAVNIGVYGYYMNTAFTLLASHVGGHSQLTAGVGMMSTASQTFECSERDADSGICLPSSAVKRQVLAAYFSFVVIPSKMLYGASKDATDSSTSGDALVITVIPSCNSTASFSTAASSLSSSSKLDKGCPAGCDCSPLRVYITSCVQGLCTSNDR